MLKSPADKKDVNMPNIIFEMFVTVYRQYTNNVY